MLLFKIFDCRFLHLLTGYFDMRFHDSRYNRHNARVRRFGSRVSYIKNFNLFLFAPDYSAMRHAIPGLLLDILRVSEDFYGGEAD